MDLIWYWAPLNGDKPGRWAKVMPTKETMELVRKNGVALMSPMAAKDVEKQVRQKGAAFMPTMAFEFEPKKGKEEPLRIGDIAIDFDCKDDPEQARKDCVKFVNYLLRNHVRPRELRYWITGSKGFHIMVPAYLFNGIQGDPLLPCIYQSMVQFITVRLWHGQPNSVDTSMYCMGKGKLLRMENIQRPNCMYKVPITWQELSTQNYDEFDQVSERASPYRDRSALVATGCSVGQHVPMA